MFGFVRKVSTYPVYAPYQSIFSFRLITSIGPSNGDFNFYDHIAIF